VTIDELRALCLSLPGAHEKETWGDAEHAGDVTFRVRDRIFAMTGPEGGSVSIRTSIEQQAELVDTFPGMIRSAPYVGRFGWVVVDMNEADDDLLRGLVEGAWRRTATKATVRAWEEGRA
jgi:predicted DNA-binding protein (MmcQ/YjbR family)